MSKDFREGHRIVAVAICLVTVENGPDRVVEIVVVIRPVDFAGFGASPGWTLLRTEIERSAEK